MPWFNVDDGFHSHPKALAAGPAALALWVMAGSWSAKHLTNGFIPRHVLATLLPNSRPTRAAERLVSVGLWEVVPGEGWQFHEWNEDGRNPTPGQVKAAKAASRERQQRYRDRQRNAVTNASLTRDVTRESQRPLPSTPYIGADAVTDPVRGQPSRRPQNPSYDRRKINPDRGERPYDRPLADALEAAGISPNGRPARGDTVTELAAQIRAAINHAAEEPE